MPHSAFRMTSGTIAVTSKLAAVLFRLSPEKPAGLRLGEARLTRTIPGTPSLFGPASNGDCTPSQLLNKDNKHAPTSLSALSAHVFCTNLMRDRTCCGTTEVHRRETQPLEAGANRR